MDTTQWMISLKQTNVNFSQTTKPIVCINLNTNLIICVINYFIQNMSFGQKLLITNKRYMNEIIEIVVGTHYTIDWFLERDTNDIRLFYKYGNVTEIHLMYSLVEMNNEIFHSTRGFWEDLV